MNSSRVGDGNMPIYVNDKNVRKNISIVYRKLRKKFPQNAEALTLRELDQLGGILDWRRKEANVETHKHHQQELSLSYLLIWGVALMFFAFYPKRGHRKPIPTGWLGKGHKPDPNDVVQKLLLQIVNYSLAVVRLTEDGLDVPASCVLRALNELAAQLLVLATHKETFVAYAKIRNPEESRDLWHQLFARGKLNRHLSNLEAQLGFDNDLLNEMRSFREHVMTTHSEAVHHSFASAVVRSWVGDFKNKEALHIGLFGKSSPRIDATLYELNCILTYAFVGFIALLVQFHGFRPSRKHDFWVEASAIANCVTSMHAQEENDEDYGAKEMS